MKNLILTDEEIAEIVARAHRGPDPYDEIEPRAVKAWYDADRNLVFFTLKNGCVFGFPPESDPWVGLEGATAAELAQVEPDLDGEALCWEAINADVSVPGLLLHLLNVKAWYAKWLGGAKTEAKAAAARENGKKGGRPRKDAAAPKQPRRHRAVQSGD